LLVEHLDEAGVAYYLVPWNSVGGTELIVRIDASTGAFLGLVEFSQPGAEPFLSASAALFRAKAKVSGVDFETARCVWRPCRESTTPFRPFFEVSYEGGTLYVDMDGVVHRSLTNLGRGG
jgi:hypothetical protein